MDHQNQMSNSLPLNKRLIDQKRAVWLPNLTVHGLNRLLRKKVLNEKEIERLKDYLWLLTYDEQSAFEKGFLVPISDCGAKGYVPKNKYWITNISHRVQEFLKTGEESWIKTDPTISLDSVPPQYKYVLFFDKSDKCQKRGRLLHGLWEYGYYYEIEGVEIQDKERNFTYWQCLGEDPIEFLKLAKEEKSKMDEHILNLL